MDDSAPAPAADPSLAAVAARVVAWQHRHPLARRITAAQVTGIGVVALPFAPVGRGGKALPVFGEDFLPPLSVRRIAAFARRHAAEARPGAEDWPQRDLPVDTERWEPDPSSPATMRHLLTAAIEVDGERRRVLLSPAAGGPVLGPRLWARGRLAAATAAVAVPSLLGLLAAVLAGRAGPVATAPVQAQASAPAARAAAAGHGAAASAAAAHGAASAAVAGEAASSAEVADAREPGHDGDEADEAAPEAAATAGHGATGEGRHAAKPAHDPANPPAHGSPHETREAHGAHETHEAREARVPPDSAAAAPRRAPVGVRPDIRPALSDDAREAARLALAEMRAQEAARRVKADRPAGFYALVAPPVRSRTEAEERLFALRAGLASLTVKTASRTELLPVDGRWQATWWPFTDREDAQAARDLLRGAGIAVELVEF